MAITSLFSGTVIPFRILPFGLTRFFELQPFGSLGGAPLSLFVGTAEPKQIILTQLFWNAVIWPTAILWFKKSPGTDGELRWVKFHSRRFLSLYGIYARMDLAWLLRDTKFALLAIFSDMCANLSSIAGVFLLAWRFDGLGRHEQIRSAAHAGVCQYHHRNCADVRGEQRASHQPHYRTRTVGAHVYHAAALRRAADGRHLPVYQFEQLCCLASPSCTWRFIN